MKKNMPSLKAIIVIALLCFPFLTMAQPVAVKSVISITQNTALPVKSIPTIGYNGYKGVVSAYPLQISATDTLFFGSSTIRDFVMNGIINAGITSITKVYTAKYGTTLQYGLRLYNYYYYCNANNYGYFSVDGLTTKQNTTFATSYSSTNNLYTVTRTYSGNTYSEAISNYAALATSLATDLTNASGTEYLSEQMENVGNLYFFLTRATPQGLTITAGGPTTFSTGGSVVLTSAAPSGNTWYNNGTAIPGATGTTYTATTSGSYTASTTAPGFTTAQSNAIVVTVNAIAPLTVSGSKLLNHSGNPVILHAVNTASYHSGYVNDVASISNSIKTNSKVNAVRLAWNSTQFVTDMDGANAPPYFTLPYLDAELQAYTNAHLLPVLMLHDLTDDFDNSVTGFNKYVVGFWTDPNLITILKKYQNNLIINLQNEWGATYNGMTGATFIATYKSLMVQLRNLGINCPIMIDAPDGGANSQFLITNGAGLIAADPIKNVILSVHTYWSQENGYITNCPTDYTTKVKAMANSGLPFMLGEVSDWAVRGSDGADIPSTPPVSFVCPGTASPNKYAVNYDAILTEACADGISYFAWSWYQDGNLVRNIYNQDNGLSINTSSQAGIYPADMMTNGKVYGLTNASIVPVW